MLMPAWAKDHSTRPEQSKEDGPAPPHTYGRPRLLSAARSAVVSWAAVSAPPGGVPGTIPTGDAPPGRVTSVTSGSTDAPFGSTALILAAIAGTLAGGELTTRAFLAGTPSEAGTGPDTTASRPRWPTGP